MLIEGIILMAKLLIDVDNKMDKAIMEVQFNDLEDVLLSVPLITAGLIYKGMQGLKMPTDEEQIEKVLKSITALICELISEFVSIEGYKEFCEVVSKSGGK